MHRQRKKAAAVAVSAAVAVALAAGMTSPASAEPELPASAGKTKNGVPRAGAPQTRITLITGDRVLIDSKGRPVGLERAKGREKIPVKVTRLGDRTLVVPADAARLIREKKLDERLFDITALNRSATRKAHKRGLKVIVGYKGAAAGARADVREAGDTTVRRTLKSLNAEAVLTPRDDANRLWKALTEGDGTTAAGISRIWLDGVRKVNLDKSRAQIGVPKAWGSGYDGKGVKIAVLDSGVDDTHPDLKGQVTAAKNFSTASGTGDSFGHGTHVASIAAGTGAKSGGKYKGVAPGATILNGKVLDDYGYGDDSGIIEGMDWAVAQGADIINMSLGGTDTSDIDPMEAAVNRLADEHDVLFAVAAGNNGRGEKTVENPGTARAALTVGAVDDSDDIADFSSSGPGLDGQVKPDLTAPGVDITAASAKGSLIAQEAGENPAGYVSIEGTSMATPHVAGAAAILKQRHPDWSYKDLKGALTASTKPGNFSVFEQGSGRVQVDRALEQTVIADPVSVHFGEQQWPHHDDAPLTKPVTYKNLGTEDVTLSLSVTATDPRGRTAPAGLFTLGAKSVTVPAGGTASVDLTADTRLGGTVDGAYSAVVTATGGGQGVRTAVAVERERESYDVTLKTIGRDGAPTGAYRHELIGVSGAGRGRHLFPHEASGTVKVRLPKGGYLLDSTISADAEDPRSPIDWIGRPKLTVDKDTTITVDARAAKPVRITPPVSGAKIENASAEYEVATDDDVALFSVSTGDGWDGLRSAHVGPQITDGSLYQRWDTHWSKGKDLYSAVSGGKVKKLATGYTKKWKSSEFAKVKARLGATADGKKGAIRAEAWLPGREGTEPFAKWRALPLTQTLHLSTANGVRWEMRGQQITGLDTDGLPITDSVYGLNKAEKFRAGKTYEKTFNVGVFGPRVGGGYGVFREGNSIYGYLPAFFDGKNHAGGSEYTSAKTKLYRNGTRIADGEDALQGDVAYEVPSAQATYKLTTSVRRSAKVSRVSTRVDTSFTFKSKKTSGDKLMPVSTARFAPALDLHSRGAANKKVTVPVTVQGGAAGKNLKSLTVYVSYDSGNNWKKVTVKRGKVTYKNPKAGKAISLRANITDKKGNKSSVSIYNAYYGR